MLMAAISVRVHDWSQFLAFVIECYCCFCDRGLRDLDFVVKIVSSG